MDISRAKDRDKDVKGDIQRIFEGAMKGIMEVSRVNNNNLYGIKWRYLESKIEISREQDG